MYTCPYSVMCKLASDILMVGNLLTAPPPHLPSVRGTSGQVQRRTFSRNIERRIPPFTAKVLSENTGYYAGSSAGLPFPRERVISLGHRTKNFLTTFPQAERERELHQFVMLVV